MKKIYGKQDGGQFKSTDAQEIGEYIESLEDKTTLGILNSVQEDENCIIRKYLEWDNEKAGFEYRLTQVRNIVNHITVEITERGEDVPVKAFYSVINGGNKSSKYITLETAHSNKYYRKQIIVRAKKELISWTRRYEQYKELKEVIKIINLNIEK